MILYCFSGEKYNSMNNGITSAFSHENQEWKSVAAAEFEISDYINKEKLTKLIFGPLWGQFISSFLQILSFCSGIHFLIILLRKMLKANSDCFQRPIQINVEKPNVTKDENVYHRGQSVIQINDQENVYQAQGLNFERTQKHHTLQIESDDEDFPPPYFLGSNSTYTTRHRDSFSH